MISRLLVFAALLVSGSSLLIKSVAPGKETPSLSYTFEAYVSDFEKKYNDTEFLFRKSVFEVNLQTAVAHNADASHTWKMSINQFSDRTTAEFHNSHGFLPSWASQNGLAARPAPEVPAGFSLNNLPKSVDWRQKGAVTPAKNQGMCGSCWAFGTVESIESHVAINSGKLVELSPQQLVSCSKNPDHCGGSGGCKGSVPELGYDYVKTKGIASESAYPYVSGIDDLDGKCKDGSVESTVAIDGWVKLPENNYTAVMYAIANIGPLSINVDATPMQAYSSGVMPCPSSSTDLDHVVQLVGYGPADETYPKDYWIVRNSWGKGWGDEGFVYMERHADEEFCGTDTSPADGTGCAGGPASVRVCGSCGILYDVSYPVGARLL